MRINLTNLFNGLENIKEFEYSIDMSELEYSGYFPIKEPVKVIGKVFNRAYVVYLDVNIKFLFSGQCDRCAEDVNKEYSLDINKILVEKLENEDDDDNYIIVENHELDIDLLVNEEINLNLPNKILCKEDCKGLCQKCGTNLNIKECNCKPDVDPRMEALLQLLDEE